MKDEDLSGRKVGEYEILSRIGAGGMGVVYEGVQPVIGKRVAVKVLLPQLSNDSELVERFLSEARAVNAIRHRGIVDIFSFGQTENGSHYFVMEYLDGEAFDRIIKQRAPVSPYDVLCWSEEVLDALDAAHTSGIIHRDIKPSNLFLVNTGRGRSYVKLLDFGIAKLGALKGEATPQTRASVIIGTPDYMSPEQARGRSISASTDLYALACVMFELLTGRRVFKGENPMSTMFMHVEDTPSRASDFAKGIPPELDDLLLWTLEKDPAQRPSTAAELRLHVEGLKKLVPSERTVAFTPPPRTYSGGTSTASGGSRRQPPVAADGPATPGPKIVDTEPSGKGTPAPRSRRTKASMPPPMALMDAHGDEDLAGPTKLASSPGQVSSPSLAPLSDAVLEPEPMVTKPDHHVLQPQPAKRGLPVMGMLLFMGVGAAGAGVYLALQPRQVVIVPAAPPVEAPPVAEKKPVVEEKPVVEVKPVAEEKPVVAEKPVAEKPVAKTVPKPKAKTWSAEDLNARLQSLEKKLSAKESKTGTKDRVLHQFLDQGRADAAKAKTDEDRKDVWKFLNDLDKQLGP